MRGQPGADAAAAVPPQDGYAQDECGIHHRVLQGVVETLPGVDWCAPKLPSHPAYTPLNVDLTQVDRKRCKGALPCPSDVRGLAFCVHGASGCAVSEAAPPAATASAR